MLAGSRKGRGRMTQLTVSCRMDLGTRDSLVGVGSDPTACRALRNHVEAGRILPCDSMLTRILHGPLDRNPRDFRAAHSRYTHPFRAQDIHHAPDSPLAACRLRQESPLGQTREPS